MKKLLIIVFLLIGNTFVFSQSTPFLTDSVVFKTRRISLYLNKQPKGFFHQNDITVHSLRTPFSVIDYNPLMRNGTYNASSYNVLNPYGSLDPIESLFIGTVSYFLDKTVNRK